MTDDTRDALLNMDARHLWQQKLYDLYRLGCREMVPPQESK